MPEAEGEAAAERGGLRPEGYRSFFNQTYARIQPDGTMYFGVEAAFLASIGEPLSIEVSKVGESVSQGFPFGAITNSNMRVFNLRSPFSGRVLKVNQDAMDNMNLVREDPWGKGWLLQVTPTDFETELDNLAG